MLKVDQARPSSEIIAKPSLLRFLDPRYILDSLSARGNHLWSLIAGLRRRQGWFLEGMTMRRAINMFIGGSQWALKSEHMYAFPAAVKIDISPMCNLSCTVCVHADPNGDASLESQQFHPQHRMSVEQFRGIIKQLRGRCSAVSLYYVGDPLVHPDLDEMSSIAFDAGLNVHISTNFSFALTDARIRRIVTSGLTHLSVCVDGLSQAKYEMTRVGGKIDRVLNNLERVCKVRDELGRKYPHVEVQYIKFRHNADEVDAARQKVDSIGVDQFTEFWGDLGNYADRNPSNYDIIGPRKAGKLPLCYWPHNSMVIKYNGDVIPCCSYRIGEQYTDKADPKIFGNIFETSIAEVWNNEKYREARRMVNDPGIVEKEPHLKDHFCYGCGAIYEITDRMLDVNAYNTNWEDNYTMGADGRPIRKKTGAQMAEENRQRVSKLGLPNGQEVSV